MITDFESQQHVLPRTWEEIQQRVDGELSKQRSGNVWASYSRVSVEDPDHPGYSMETQPERNEEYALAHGAKQILRFADPDVSGKNSRRKGLQQMITAIKSGQVDVVVIHRLDRLYRNLLSLLSFVLLLQRYRVRLVSVTENLDTTKWWGRLVLVVLGSLAEAYLYQTSANTTIGLHQRRRKGLHLGRIPFGYCNGLCSTCTNPNGGGYCPLFGGPDRPESERGRVAVPHPVDQYAIPIIFDLYQQGYSFREIADIMTNTDYTLPDGSQARFRPYGKLGDDDSELEDDYEEYDEE